MISNNQKALKVESAMRMIEESETSYANYLSNDFTDTVLEFLNKFSTYNGIVEEQINEIKQQYGLEESKPSLDDLADESVNNLVEMLQQLNNYIKEVNLNKAGIK